MGILIALGAYVVFIFYVAAATTWLWAAPALVAPWIIFGIVKAFKETNETYRRKDL